MEILNLKPYHTQVLFSHSFETVADLQKLLAEAVLVSGQDSEYINVDFDSNERFVSQCSLEAEALSDGSIVYNLILTP